MAQWHDLTDELQRWAAVGKQATLWWRDDDASHASPALRRLLDLSADSGVPVALAVIPEQADEGLVDLLENFDCAVFQHGLDHRNRAPASEKKSEFGPHRPVFEMLADVAIGFEGLRRKFGRRHLPVFVPPWNRIAGELLPHLPSARIAGLSAFKPRSSACPVPGLLQTNCHVDPIAWRENRRFTGQDEVLGTIVDHLVQRRECRCDPDEPTGILTHHQINDEGMWAFLEELFRITGERDDAHWLDGAQVFRLRS